MKDYKFWDFLDHLIKKNGIEIDRPKGSKHPTFSNYIYPFDYGFIRNTKSQDNSGIDIWIGSSSEETVNAVICSIDLIKSDSEVKVLYKCTKSEIEIIYKDHNRSDKMKGILIER